MACSPSIVAVGCSFSHGYWLQVKLSEMDNQPVQGRAMAYHASRTGRLTVHCRFSHHGPSMADGVASVVQAVNNGMRVAVHIQACEQLSEIGSHAGTSDNILCFVCLTFGPTQNMFSPPPCLPAAPGR